MAKQTDERWKEGDLVAVRVKLTDAIARAAALHDKMRKDGGLKPASAAEAIQLLAGRGAVEFLGEAPLPNGGPAGLRDQLSR